MKDDIKKQQFLCEKYLETESIVTVERAQKLNFKKEQKPTRQHINTIVKRFQETGSLLPRVWEPDQNKNMVAPQKVHVQNTINELICQMPNVSIREIARQTQTSYSLTRNTLRIK